MQLSAKDVCKTAIKLQPDNSIYDARNAMLKHNISRLVITGAGDDRPLGILTEKDIARSLYSHMHPEALDKMPLDRIMIKKLVTVNGQKSINSCALLMLAHKISSLIVTDLNDALLGIFTKSDLVDVYARSNVDKKRVKEYMTKEVITSSPNELLYVILLLMNSKAISRIVITLNEEPIGIITTQDLLPVNLLFGPKGSINLQASDKAGSVPNRKRTIFPSSIRRLLIARDVMKYDPITVTPDSYLSNAAQIMTRNRISGIPVVNTINNLVGIITKTDVIKGLAEEA
jgi:CBS domain-containing protein